MINELNLLREYGLFISEVFCESHSLENFPWLSFSNFSSSKFKSPQRIIFIPDIFEASSRNCSSITFSVFFENAAYKWVLIIVHLSPFILISVSTYPLRKNHSVKLWWKESLKKLPNHFDYKKGFLKKHNDSRLAFVSKVWGIYLTTLLVNKWFPGRVLLLDQLSRRVWYRNLPISVAGTTSSLN